ncbi:MAG TPA: hypothetical protein VNO21_03835, partial [Polyangiaceae bacterium]|nr:hypothetical protein [Polyangiaceae bacterium]
SLGPSARLVARFGARNAAIFGMSLIALALASFAHLETGAPYWPWRFVSYILLGLGAGNAFLPLLTIAMSEVPVRDAGLGSAIVTLSLQLSAAVDLAILATASSQRRDALLAAHVTPLDALVGGYRFAYAVATGGVLIGIVLVAVLFQPRARAGSASTGTAAPPVAAEG